ARHLALIGRSNQKSANLASALERWKKSGVEARVLTANLEDRASVETLFAEIGSTMPPLRGIIHAATRYESATLANADAENLRGSLGAKSIGASHLDACSVGLDLDFFVLYSSVAGVLGNAGQAGYAAANAYLEGLAAKRRSEGKPALVVHWGALSDAGHVADHAEIASLLESRGLGGMTAAESTDALGQIMRSGASEAMVARIRWEDAAGLGIGAGSPRLQELVASSAAGVSAGGKNAREAILSLPAAERLDAMTADLAVQLSEILRLPEASIQCTAPLKDLGLDSLISIETVIRIERRFAVSLPQGWISADTTLEDLAGKLLQLISTTSAEPAAAAESTLSSAERPAPATRKTPEAAIAPEIPTDSESQNVSAGFYFEWMALRAMEKFLLGRDIVAARKRLVSLLPVFRTALRSDWQWSLKNLELVFGPNLDETQRRKLALLAMENHLASYLESGFSHGMEFEFDNYAELLELAGDRGVILCGVHLGSWEPFLRWAPDIGLRLAAVYRKARNPLAERTFQQRRALYGIEWIPSGDVRAIAQAIDDRKIVAFMTDLNTYERPLFPDFLGAPASFAPGPCALSVLKGAPLIAGVGIRHSVSKVSATFAPAIWPDTDRPIAAETLALAVKLNDFFGPRILEHAEQYNWLHPRWRCRPDGSVWTLKTPAKEMAMARTAPYAIPSDRLLSVI
ncbi:MAG: KR domain-containing protein, partial [Chthoniobacterales bacterium]